VVVAAGVAGVLIAGGLRRVRAARL
jgi:hypothetical protein